MRTRTDLWQDRGNEEKRQKEEDERRAKKEVKRRLTEKESDEEAKERRGGKGRSAKEGREGPPLSADKRQKWMNSIGRRTSSSLLSARLHELRTHFIEICEIRKAGYRVIYHRATLAHTSSQLHNKSHNWHSFFGLLTIICCSLYKVALGLLFSRSNKLGWVSVWEICS